MLYAPRPSVRIMRRTTMVALSLVGLIAFLSTIESATAAEVECRDKAKDSNHNGVIDADETQECGGQEYGEGGSDGAKLPPVSPSSHQWQGYHWSRPSDGERKVIMRDSTTDGWDGYLGDAIRDWGDSSRFRFTRQQAATSSDERFACSMPSNYGRVRVCNHADYNLSGFTGLASIRVNSEGHIQRGRVRVKNSAATGDRRALLCQEVGHTIQERGPLAGRGARPVGRVEGAPGGDDRLLDLRVRRDIDLGDDAGVGRVDDRRAGAVAGRDPRSIDEQARHGRPLDDGSDGALSMRPGGAAGQRASRCVGRVGRVGFGMDLATCPGNSRRCRRSLSPLRHSPSRAGRPLGLSTQGRLSRLGGELLEFVEDRLGPAALRDPRLIQLGFRRAQPAGPGRPATRSAELPVWAVAAGRIGPAVAAPGRTRRRRADDAAPGDEADVGELTGERAIPLGELGERLLLGSIRLLHPGPHGLHRV